MKGLGTGVQVVADMSLDAQVPRTTVMRPVRIGSAPTLECRHKMLRVVHSLRSLRSVTADWCQVSGVRCQEYDH
jgi:hypothetical protein